MDYLSDTASECLHVGLAVVVYTRLVERFLEIACVSGLRKGKVSLSSKCCYNNAAVRYGNSGRRLSGFAYRWSDCTAKPAERRQL